MTYASRGLAAALASAVLSLGLSAAAQTDKALPAAQQKGLEAVIAVHGQCQ